MSPATTSGSRLARLARASGASAPAEGGVRAPAGEAPERCELCSAPIPPAHRHVLDVGRHELQCTCRPCSLLFDRPAAALGHLRLVPERIVRLEDFALDDRSWRSLRIPVELAWFAHSTPAGRVQAFYPSPMGPTESLLELRTWTDLVARNPVLEGLEPDVQALLVNRTPRGRGHWLVGIDACYELVGLMRTRWRGLAGGADVWQAIDGFFARLDARARPAPRPRIGGTWPA